MEQIPKVIAKKCYKDETGMVCISGWKGHQSETTPILVIVVDRWSQAKWTRLLEQSSSKRNTLKVKIPRSAVHHQITVTAELLRENHSWGTDVDGLKRFTVESTSSCDAALESSQLELLAAYCEGLSLEDSLKEILTTISMEIERGSNGMARLRLKKSRPGVRRWLITVEDVEASDQKDIFLQPAQQPIIDFEFPIEDGHEYRVEAIGLDPSGGNIYCHGSTTYRTVEEVEANDRKGDFPDPILKGIVDFEFPIEDGGEFHFDANDFCQNSINYQPDQSEAYFAVNELRQLHEMAVAHAGQRCAPCLWLYRNKKPEYFDDIISNHGGIMKPYLKDNSGDQRSPINGRINGCFFMASVKRGSKEGKPMKYSAFGKLRVLVPAGELLAKAPNLYFTDFYCMRGKPHYVTLVMTRPHSSTDKFCSDHLISLSLHDRSLNPFLFYEDGRLRVSTKKNLMVELLFTEDLDIGEYKREETKIGNNCRGHSKPGGIPKNLNCSKCNLPSSRQTSILP